MNAETLKALKNSIRKWGKIVNGKGTDTGANNCPLCKIFFEEPHCGQCPVAIKTGMASCFGTPFVKWVDAVRRCLVKTTGRGRRVCGRASCKCHKTAQAELDFLKSLLPTEGGKRK